MKMKKAIRISVVLLCFNFVIGFYCSYAFAGSDTEDLKLRTEQLKDELKKEKEEIKLLKAKQALISRKRKALKNIPGIPETLNNKELTSSGNTDKRSAKELGEPAKITGISIEKQGKDTAKKQAGLEEEKLERAKNKTAARQLKSPEVEIERQQLESGLLDGQKRQKENQELEVLKQAEDTKLEISRQIEGKKAELFKKMQEEKLQIEKQRLELEKQARELERRKQQDKEKLSARKKEKEQRLRELQAKELEERRRLAEEKARQEEEKEYQAGLRRRQEAERKEAERLEAEKRKIRLEQRRIEENKWKQAAQEEADESGYAFAGLDTVDLELQAERLEKELKKEEEGIKLLKAKQALIFQEREILKNIPGTPEFPNNKELISSGNINGRSAKELVEPAKIADNSSSKSLSSFEKQEKDIAEKQLRLEKEQEQRGLKAIKEMEERRRLAEEKERQEELRRKRETERRKAKREKAESTAVKRPESIKVKVGPEKSDKRSTVINSLMDKIEKLDEWIQAKIW